MRLPLKILPCLKQDHNQRPSGNQLRKLIDINWMPQGNANFCHRRKRSLSSTPSLEELITDSPFKPNIKTESNDKAHSPSKPFHVSNESYHSNPLPSLKSGSPSAPKLSSVQEEETTSSVEVGHDDNVTSLLDDDDLAARPRTVRTPRKKRR